MVLVDTKTCYLMHWKIFVRFCPFLCVFVRFGRFARSCPLCTLPRAPLETKNSQESLEIIIYIQTASHKNFSMWWPLELSVPSRVPAAGTLLVQTLSDFEDSRPIFLVFQNGHLMCYLMLLWYLWLLSHALKNFCPFWPFLCVLADLAVLARFVHFLGYHWGQQTARKVWKL